MTTPEGRERMKRISVTVAILLAISTSAFAQTKRYLVGTVRPSLQGVQRVMTEDLEPRAFRDIVPFENVNAFAVDLTAEEVAALRKSRNVRYVEEDAEVHALTDAVTAGADTTPFGVNMVNAPAVWPITKGDPVDGGARVHVVIIDTGITPDDADLAAAYKGGYNVFNPSSRPIDDNGHGTHVAGTIAAAQNGAGVVGVAPNVDVYSVKVLDACGSGSTSMILSAIDWVIAQKQALGGNWIMSLSLGFNSTSPQQTLAAQFQKAADAGILTFAAAGNDYDKSPVDGLSYPAALPTVVSVGAIDETRQIASFSQRGPDLKLVAPGVSVLSTFIGEQVATDDGRKLAAVLPSGGEWCPTTPNLVSASFVDCGLGGPGEFPSSVQGKIALIQRGNYTFVDKAINAKKAGAIAAVIYMADGGTPIVMDVSKAGSASAIVPMVMLSQADGLALKTTPTAKLTTSFGYQTYATLSGTSMATPHASAAAALVWSVAPNATANQIALALENNAQDLGASGFDTVYGYGLVDALAAAKSLAPQKFGSAAQPPPTQPVSGRRILRRGH